MMVRDLCRSAGITPAEFARRMNLRSGAAVTAATSDRWANECCTVFKTNGATHHAYCLTNGSKHYSDDALRAYGCNPRWQAPLTAAKFDENCEKIKADAFGDVPADWREGR